MREWDEITRDILRKRDEKIARKKAQMRTVRNTVISAVCVCIAATAGIGAWKYAPERNKPANSRNEQSTTSCETTAVST